MESSVVKFSEPECRDATILDVDSIFHLMEGYTEQGVLLPRSKGDIIENLTKFSVIQIHGEVVACAALEIFNADLAEIRSLVVANSMKRQGLGMVLVDTLTDKARALGLRRLMALTYVPTFFHRAGFHTVPKEIFPEKVWGVCYKCSRFNDCDEIAVLKFLR